MTMYDNFLRTLDDYYAAHCRYDLPWRLPEADGSFDPYQIVVSELMLQQTQVSRVVPKFHLFMQRFPSFQALADASLGEVLMVWQGLGYNRRAKFLWQAAQAVAHDCGGRLPRDQRELERLPGIGHNTAGAILAYAYNLPTVFIETNIRTVYIHHFFKDRNDVVDSEIARYLAETLTSLGKRNARFGQPGNLDAFQKRSDKKLQPAGTEAPAWSDAGVSYREFYWSLMDYGTHLKQSIGNLSRASKTYARQSKFQGSLRQIRGKALRTLAAGPQSVPAVLQMLDDKRAAVVLVSLEREGLIVRAADQYRLP